MWFEEQKRYSCTEIDINNRFFLFFKERICYICIYKKERYAERRNKITDCH